MSNALLAAPAATRPAGGGEFTIPAPLLGLIAVGVPILIGWAVLRRARPEKFYLRRVPGRPNHLNALHVLTAYLVFHVCSWVIYRALLRATGSDPEVEAGAAGPLSILATTLGQLVLLAVSLTIASMSFRHGLRRGLGLSARRWLWDSGRAVVGFLAVLPLCVLALFLAGLVLPPTEHPMLKFVKTASPAWKAVTVFSAVVVAPLAEEVFFRGLVQSMARRYLRSAWVAIVAGSAVFAVSHGPHYSHMPALFLLAVAMGYNYERTGRLLGPILLHALFNAVMVWAELSG